jgi:hypothetical protein
MQPHKVIVCFAASVAVDELMAEAEADADGSIASLCQR